MALREVRLESGTPAILVFTSAYRRLSMGQRGPTGAERIVRLPVPRGCEQEAEALVAQFREGPGNA